MSEDNPSMVVGEKGAGMTEAEKPISYEEMTKAPLPILVKGRWIRFSEKMDYGKPNANLIVGGKETGKSALCEALATHYSEQDKHSKILDFFGSRDNEGLSWCRSPYKEGVLLLTGDSVKVHSRWPSVKVSDFKLSSMKGHKVVITVSAFYSTLLEENRAIKTIMEELWKRESWDHLWCLIIREMANLLFSRLSIGEDQYKAKATMTFLLRQMRHMGYALCGDSIKSKSVDADIRDLADYTFIKACGKEGLPKDLQFLYSLFKPFSITRMPKDQFIVISRYASIGRGYFACPPWHKRENENLFKLLNIEVEHTEAPDLDMKAGHISDREHVRIIDMRKTGNKGDPLSFNKLAVKTERSLSTVYNTVLYHNDKIDALKECDRCKRLNGQYATVKV